ncbi:MAG: RagB/SusD family nutrient uptake outer membrane protein [Prevotella sp.]|jgi:hypothetical protein
MKISKYILLAAAPLMLTGCLDTEPLGSNLTSDEKASTVEENPDRLEASVNAITAAFSQYMKIRSAHSDFGYPAIMLHLESRGVDMVSDNIGYNWFGFSLTYDNIDYTYGNDREIWGTLYNQIYAANAVTATVDSATTDPTLQYYLGQALAIRAFDYFNLIQIYQKTYSQVDPTSAKGVPVITEKNRDEAATNGCSRGTVEQTYNQILSDLNRAIELFDASGMTRADKRYANSSVAHAIRARVYLVMNRWSEAAADAQYVINNSGCTPKSMSEVGVPSFNSLDEADWLWGIKIEETDDVVESGIVNWPSHMGSLCYGYATVGAWKRINKKLYNNIPSTDKRKTWFTDENAQSAGLTATQQAYIDEQGAPGYVHVKFAPYNNEVGTSINANDIPLIRIEEMYYILAEAQAMAGDVSTGRQTLVNFVTTYRNPSYTCTATTGTGVQEACFQQRRIEFWGEGLSWFDYIRLNKDFDRRGGGFGTNEVYNIAAGDNALIWRIPYNEIQYNAQISEEDNNPVPTHPVAVEDE